jgi:peptidoglycan/xylan/chitin deacetylase (PgdA/CDA1 family)
MRTLLRKIFLDILSVGRKPSPFIHILNGHFIDERDNNFSEQHFELLIQKFLSSYHIISLDEAVSMITNKAIVDHPKLALTFDDGFLECYTKMIPVLEKYNVKAAFFINPMSIENKDDNFASSFIKNNLRVELSKKFMTWDMIREIQTLGHTIGSHTTSHANLKGLSSVELQKEIVQSKEEIERATEKVCNYFAFPFGNQNYFDKNSVDLVNQTYDYSFTSGLYSNYFFKGDIQILSRRHFECNWPINHIKYFTSGKREINLKL